jgi:hypothetical protein
MPPQKNKHTQSMPVRSGASTARADAKKALRRKFLRELPPAVDAIAAEFQKNSHPFVRPVLWLGSQAIPFNEQPPEMQQQVPRGFLEELTDTAVSLRSDFHAMFDGWGQILQERLKSIATELWEIDPDIARTDSELEQICADVEAREIESGKAWAVPGWLNRWPEGIERVALRQATFRGQLDAASKTEVLSAIKSRVRERLTTAKAEARDHVRILAGKEKNKHLVSAIEEQPQNLARVFSHNPDYHSVTFKGQSHFLTHTQAAIVKMLHRAYLLGTPALSQAFVMEAEEVGLEGKRFQDTFRGTNLWGKDRLIFSGPKKGTVRLNLPDPPATQK